MNLVNAPLLRFGMFWLHVLVLTFAIFLGWQGIHAIPLLAEEAEEAEDIVTVDRGVGPGIVGMFSSLAVVDGQPAVSYYDTLNKDLKYSYFDGTTWQSSVVDSNGEVFSFSSLAVVNGQPAISYCDSTDRFLKYAYFDGTAWTTMLLDNLNTASCRTSLATIDGQPAIAYYEITSTGFHDYEITLNLARFEGTSWLKTTVDSEVGEPASLSLAAIDGQPAISYYDTVNNTLSYAYFDGSTWQKTTVDDAIGAFTSLIAIDGQPAISYHAEDGLKYAQFDGIAWQISTVDSNERVDVEHSLAVVNGQPAISYSVSMPDIYASQLHYAYFDGSSWQSSVLDAYTFASNSLAVVAGQPAVSFFVYGDGYPLSGLWYADFDGTQWHYQNIDVGTGPGVVGEYNALAEIAGQPAISYLDRLAHTLNYAYFDGETWLTTTVVPKGVRGSYTALTEVDGQPAISYHVGISGTLEYARFDGTNWLTTTITSSGQSNWGTSTSLVVMHGQPAISYHYVDSGGVDNARQSLLNYAWFDGVEWLTTTVDSAVGNSSSLAMVNGQPAISYDAVGNLNYAWFDGTRWFTTTVDSSGNVGGHNSLVAVKGQPAISYTRTYPRSENSNTRHDLLYAQFDGISWITTTIDSGINQESYSRLAEVNGYPAISYYNYTHTVGEAIKYAWFTGTRWQRRTISRDGDIYLSLAMINGHPAISFTRWGNDGRCRLQFVQLDLTDFSYVQVFLPLINN